MFNLITVVYKPERCYLAMQARSIQLYIPKNLLGNIYVIINDDEMKTSDINIEWWGENRDKVKILHYSQFFLLNNPKYEFYRSGWDTQQLCKIFASTICEEAWSIVLDAKTIFVKKVMIDKLITSDGKVKTGYTPSFTKQMKDINYDLTIFEKAERTVEKLFNIKIDELISPNGVPFIFRNSIVRQMVRDVEILTKKPFNEFFLDNTDRNICITEFILYSGYIIYKYGTFESFYYPLTTSNELGSPRNLAHFNVSQFNHFLIDIKSPTTGTVSIPIATWSLLSEEQKLAYLTFLESKNILSNPKFALVVLDTVINEHFTINTVIN